MIDIGFTKLAVIGVVALVVIGPEKLPTVARMAGSLFGRAQRYINDIKAEVSREMELDELRKTYQDAKDEVETAASEIENSISKGVAEAKRTAHAAWDDNLSADHVDAVALSGNVEQLAVKAKNFRKKKLAKNSAIPAWYKNQNGRKVRVLSGAARVAKYSPSRGKNTASFYS